jgi:hypothetical protein
VKDILGPAITFYRDGDLSMSVYYRQASNSNWVPNTDGKENKIYSPGSLEHTAFEAVTEEANTIYSKFQEHFKVAPDS